MIAPCGCALPRIDRSPRARRRAAIDAAREGADRDGVYSVLRFLGESHVEATGLSLWAVRVAREEAEKKKAA